MSATARTTASVLAAVLKNIAPDSPYRAPQANALAQFRLDCESVAEALSQEDKSFHRESFLEECGLVEVDRRLYSTASLNLQVRLQKRANRWFLAMQRGTGINESHCLIELSAEDGQRAEVFFGFKSLKPLVD